MRKGSKVTIAEYAISSLMYKTYSLFYGKSKYMYSQSFM